MKQRYRLFYALPLLLSGYIGSIPNSQASENPQVYPQAAAPTTQNNQPVVLSYKCAIYSGICIMTMPTAVGAYCVCHTPAGINYGVVIP